jgi:hypothetical protein
MGWPHEIELGQPVDALARCVARQTKQVRDASERDLDRRRVISAWIEVSARMADQPEPKHHRHVDLGAGSVAGTEAPQIANLLW